MDVIENLDRIVSHRPGTAMRIVRSILGATLVSLVCSSVAAYVCLVFAGAGHAAASPCMVFFGPLVAYVELAEIESTELARFINLTVGLMFVFYCLYGMVISVGRCMGRGRLAFALVLCIHYCGVGACMTSQSWDGLQNIWLISERYGGWISVFLVELFVVLHLLAIQYAWSEMPYRPRLTRRVTVVLCLGFALGIIFHVITSMQATP